jgi:hypothetical protein
VVTSGATGSAGLSLASCESAGPDLLSSIQQLIQPSGQARPDDPHNAFVVAVTPDQRVVSFLYGSGLPLPVYLVTGEGSDPGAWQLLAEHAGAAITTEDPLVREAAELVRTCTMGG